MKACVDAHPILSAVVQAEDSSDPTLVRHAELDLKRHVCVQVLDDTVTSEEDVLKSKLSELHDVQFDHGELNPPWRVVAIPLAGRAKCVVAFVYSHSVGDGLSGLAFQRTFLDNLRTKTDWNGRSTIPTPDVPLLPTIDDRLSISWAYLLGPILGTYLPNFVSKCMGFPTHLTPLTDSTWTALPTFYKPEAHKTGIEFIEINSETVEAVRNECRKHQARISGLLHQFIVHALSISLPSAVDNRDFVSATATNLRQHLTGFPSDAMGLYSSSFYAFHCAEGLSTGSADAIRELDYDRMWSEARILTSRFAESAATTKNQPIGLLKYIRNLRLWTLGQIGKRRSNSYELSNAMSFDPTPEDGIQGTRRDSEWKLEKLIFSQPANATGSALNFNVVSLKGGPMVISLTWQVGALGIIDEADFAKRVCSIIKSEFERFSEMYRED